MSRSVKVIDREARRVRACPEKVTREPDADVSASANEPGPLMGTLGREAASGLTSAAWRFCAAIRSWMSMLVMTVFSGA
jgi:hypothetical protein